METGLNIGIAFLAGILSFLSPCILPLIPAYLSLMGGTSLADLKESGKSRRHAFINTIFFVIGFTLVFAVLGVLFSTTFALLGGVSRIINVVAGAVVILLGVNIIFDFWKVLNIEKRFQISTRPTSKPSSLLFGMAFGAGWSPCIGPILSSILFLAGSSGNLLKGLGLLGVYSFGLGVPFLLTGAFLPAALRQISRLKRHLGAIKTASGLFLVFISVLILVGRLQQFNIVLFSLAYRLEAWEEASPIGPRLLFGCLFLALATLILALYLRRIRRDRTRTNEPEKQGQMNVDAAAPSSVRAFRPVRVLFVALFAAASIMSFTGLLNISRLLAAWFSFQGI